MSSITPKDGAIMVIGGSGFLGSYVADALTDNGYKVKIFDLNPSPWLKKGQEMIIGDILDPKAMEEAISGCKAVYHFAGLADIDEAINRPIDTCKLNVLGCVNALEATRKAGAVRFIYASSVYVYSRSGHFYRASKQAAEMFIEAFHERYQMDYTILRYGSLYGRRADYRNGLYRLLYDAMTKHRISYGGTGEELREYIHVHDAAELSVEVLKEEYANKNIILTGNEKMSVRNVMIMINEILGNDIELEFSDVYRSGHYLITPYAFNPRMGKKMVSNIHTDMGQGLLDLIEEIHEKINDNNQ
ncbi:MAG: NAD(P)-dependent oxidoreductase [Nitrospirae bacterium]|nr:NAD(P)-dependent oxidoreductase [Nitrospirota bacterium]MBF0541697.1 NAD(P)-dependent oxidoreductase [Nitrospirota bacterium]